MFFHSLAYIAVSLSIVLSLENIPGDETIAYNSIENDYRAPLRVDSDFSDRFHKKMQHMDADCWLKLNTKEHCKVMDDLEERYAEVRKQFQDDVGDKFDKQMLNVLLATKGTAFREAYKAGRDARQIPAGLNLGGYCMMRMQDSLLFFHRMKLRNNTNFRINYLHNDLMNMALIARLSLYDLHLLGSYERSVTDKDPSVLLYVPSYGQAELLLKNVEYKMEARLRLVKDRFVIELINSQILVEDILMTYLNVKPCASPIRLRKQNIDDFLERLKTDLDKWLKDYFNDYLIFFGVLNVENSEFQEYEKQKAVILNDFADYSLKEIKQRIVNLKASSVRIPNFKIFATPATEFELKNGMLRGLDSIYRRSVATGIKNDRIRKVDIIVGFSNLKVIYQYEAILSTGMPPLTGQLVLSADELTAHMGISMVNESETVNLDFDFLQQMKPESLTVEGSANKIISSFRHLLEYHIIAIMSNTLVHNIKMLKSLSRCEPLLFGNDDNQNSEERKTSEKRAEYENNNSGGADYVLTKHDSAEIEVPNSNDEIQKKKFKINYNENITITEIKS